MSKTAATATFSELLRSPKDVLSVLADAGEVVLTRRQAPSLRLTQESDSQQELSTLGIVGQLFAASLDEVALERVAKNMAVTLPWIGLLPKKVHAEFISEFHDTARACIAVNRFGRLSVLLNAWEATAEAYADPSLNADDTDLEYLDEPEAVPAPDLDA